MKKDSPVVLFLIIVIFVVIGVFGVLYLQEAVPDPARENASRGDSEKAAIRCEEVVKAGLRNADKASLSGQKIKDLGNNRYQITGNVDAPNASGIIVRGNYNCIFNFNTKSFDLLSLEGDDVWKPLK